MILPKLSPKSSGNSILRLTDNLGICCGDGKSCYLTCKYKVALDLSKTASISSVEIDGKNYPFDVVVNPSTSAGQKLLIEKLETALNQAGYDGKEGFYYELKDGVFHIESDYAAAKLGKLGDVAFEKTACKMYGDCEGSDCCDVALVFNVVNPSKYSFTIDDTVGASGDVIKVLDAEGADVVCWVSDGLGINSFMEGGAAYEAMTNAGIEFSVDDDLGKVYILNSDVALASLYNYTQDAEIAPIAADEPTYLVICPTACKPITNVSVSLSLKGQDVFSGTLNGAGCQFFSPTSFAKDGCIYIMVDDVAEGTVYDVTVETEGCPPYTESYTIYPQDEVVVEEGCEAWEACHDGYKAALQQFCDVTKALEAGLEVGDEFIIGHPSDLGTPGARICLTQELIDAQSANSKTATKAKTVRKATVKKENGTSNK